MNGAENNATPYCPLLKMGCLKSGCALFVVDWQGVPEDSSSPVPIRGHCGLILDRMRENPHPNR